MIHSFSVILTLNVAIALTTFPTTLNAQSRSDSRGDAYQRYADGLLRNYDRNKDGVLSGSELNEMRRPPKNADTNKDGNVSREELVSAIMNPRRSVKTSQNSTAERSERRSEKASPTTKSPVNVRINLFQFKSDLEISMARQIVKLLNQNDDSAKIIDAIADLEEVIATDELYADLPEGRKLEFGSNSGSGNDLFSVQATLIDADPTIKCNLEIQKTATKDKYSSIGSAPSPQKIQRDIQNAIRDQLNQRGGNRGRNYAAIAKSNSEPWYLEIKTSVHCDLGETSAMIFKHDGRLWMLVTTFGGS